MNFVGRFFLLVLVLGFAELYLLVHVASALGFWNTLFFCVFTGVVGGSLVRAQGLRTLMEIQSQASQGQLPAAGIVSGLVLLIVGVMLLTPGFITDALGFLFLIPPLRLAAAGRLAGVLQRRMESGGMPGSFSGGPFAGGPFNGAPFNGGQPPFGQHPFQSGDAGHQQHARGQVIDIEPEGEPPTPHEAAPPAQAPERASAQIVDRNPRK